MTKPNQEEIVGTVRDLFSDYSKHVSPLHKKYGELWVLCNLKISNETDLEKNEALREEKLEVLKPINDEIHTHYSKFKLGLDQVCEIEGWDPDEVEGLLEDDNV